MADAPTRDQNVTVRRGAPMLTPSRRPSEQATPAPARSNETDTVQVWPHLVVIEFLGAVVITINLILLATLVNSPLEELANPDRTPNPSKAPWYFLNLQELLLHMNPALAGVIIPTLALIALAAIPYVDRGNKGLGVWFYSKRGPWIMLVSSVYTLIGVTLLLALDTLFPLKDNFQNWLTPPTGWLSGVVTAIAGSDTTSQADLRGAAVEAIVGWIFPIIAISFLIGLLIFLLRRAWRDIELSEMVVAQFTGFFAVFVILTFVGTYMRGPGMHLFPPWAVPPTQPGGLDLHHWLALARTFFG